MTAGRTPEWRDVSELRQRMEEVDPDDAATFSAAEIFNALNRAARLPGRAARVLTEQEGGPPNERWERAEDDAPRLDHFLATLDRMVNEDRIDDPREVRAALDEAQATIRRLRAGGGVTAGQDEPRELRGLIHDALQTVVEAVTELRQVNPGDLGADELDAARRKLIRARAIADRVGAAPAVDTAAPLTAVADLTREAIREREAVNRPGATATGEEIWEAAGAAGLAESILAALAVDTAAPDEHRTARVNAVVDVLRKAAGNVIGSTGLVAAYRAPGADWLGGIAERCVDAVLRPDRMRPKRDTAAPDRQALASTILDSFATHEGETWLTLAEHAADAVTREGLDAAPNPLRAPVEALLAALYGVGLPDDVHCAVAEVRRHLDGDTNQPERTT